MKKRLCLLLIVLILTTTGCTIKKLDESSYDKIINQVLESNITLNNVTLDGYKYYLPKDMSLYEKSDSNSVLNYNRNKVYLYVDLISYYHKTDNRFKEDSESYYSKNINYKDKFGYIEINKIKNGYFVEIMYNYAKIEAYVRESQINDIIYNSMVLLSSINYNDTVIESLVGDNSLNYSTENYNIFEPKNEINNYLDWLDTYEEYDGEIIIDEDRIELNENEE